MAQVLHGCARTTEKVRQEIQNSEKSIAQLARELKLNVKTVARWKKRNYTHDTPMGPKNPRSTVLSVEEEAIIVLFRKKTLLGLDDCLYALKDKIPHLTRSSLHRCLQRHGISKLPQEKVEKRAKKAFKQYKPGYFHIDICFVRTEEKKLYLFVAIDRTTKYVYAELHERQTKEKAVQFLENLIALVPYQINTILTDNGAQFVDWRRAKNASVTHAFSLTCINNKIEHRITKPYHPWTNGQVERMNKTLKEATVKKFYYKTYRDLDKHLALFINAYNFGKKLSALQGKTPYEAIVDFWEKSRDCFLRKPTHNTMGLNN